MSWRPLLDGDLRDRALEAAADILAELPDPGATRDGSLASGEAGLALVAEYATRAGLGEFRGAAHDLLVSASRYVKERRPGRGLFEGATGVAWAIEHLGAGEDRDPNAGIDAGLAEALATDPGEPYDLIEGLVGIGVYALERGDRASPVLEAVVRLLAGRVERTEEGGTLVSLGAWANAPGTASHPERYYNLGLAHGVPGVIALLGSASARGVEGLGALIEELARWLLAHEEDHEHSRIPSWVIPGEEANHGRTAWCYGDPGAAAALILAGRGAGLPEVEREGVRLATGAAARPFQDSRVRDASLCHGAGGLLHLFNRLWQETGDDALRGAALRWADCVLAMRSPGEGIAGFTTLEIRDGEERFVGEPGVLTGAGGVALALLAAATDVEPAWDRHLLLSPPGPA